ncbi:MAG: putative epoxide hydrolase [Ilumatobacteraceae bacterium]|nr:putative epoxide hydrolase [Ilumatobacteraceae bacterium]
MSDLSPHPISVAEGDLVDLRDRLRRTRWPEREAVDDWSQGIPLAYVQELCAHWADGYDWRRVESELNRFEQLRFTPDVGAPDALGIQVLHAPSPHPGALPLVLTHGWPGSVVEFLDVVEPLRDPTINGGDAADAFHVVCPTMPGYGFSDKPTRTGWGVDRIADAWAELMAALGYEQFGAQGGDWGSAVTTALGVRHPDRCIGIHLNMVSVGPGKNDDMTDAERAAIAALEDHRAWGMGYSTQQSTRPQTLGYGLVDSPAAQAAWIVEKFWAWADHSGHPEDTFTRDRLLDNVMHYWLPAAGASSARLYWESFNRFRSSEPINAPAGMSLFPKEIFRPSRRWAERRFTDIRHWHELDSGGHFAAFEQPDVFVDEVRSFFRMVRDPA